MMRNLRLPKRISGCLCAMGLAACQTTDIPPEVSAVLVNPSAAVKAQLHTAVTDMLGNNPSLMSDTALTDGPTLTIERKRVRDASGALMQGRDFGKPHVFQLLKRGGECVLLHQQSGKRVVLTDAQCEAAKS